ncbi:hypothetical protein Rhe02_32840 [Rhizocola hellebori]|uniref:SnoaL-like domain-containing protein n=2 Tax=Rhizocola hellebori TaxID=1392758 RepID=A0A8J3VGJ7_9ACTN|nr:hypothetical protein Rhe02_32840 [Rhizocola hellebori]
MLTEFVEFLQTGQLRPDVFATDAVIDFNVPSWRFSSRGPAAIAQQRHAAGPGPWQVVVDRAEPTPRGFVVELHHAHADQYYRTLSLVTVANGRILEVVHYCTGNWDAAAREAYAAQR